MPKVLKAPLPQTAFRIGDRVTNSLGWDGRITKIDPKSLPDAGDYYWVHWQEREHHKEKVVARSPICGHTPQEIQRWEGKS